MTTRGESFKRIREINERRTAAERKARDEQRVADTANTLRNPYRFKLRAPLDTLYQPVATKAESKLTLLPGVVIVIAPDAYIVTYRSIEYVVLSVNDEVRADGLPSYYARPLDILKAVG